MSLLPLVSFHRLNAAYPSILAVARLILHHLTLIEQSGRYPLAAFLIDMPRLFERYVAAVLRRGIAAKGFKSLAQRADYLDEQRHISIRPDLLIYRPDANDPVLVLDTKYKQLRDLRTDDMSPDIYQLNAYMDRYRLERGALIYPRFTNDSAANLQFRGSGKQMSFLTLDLGGDTGEDLAQATALLLDQVTALARGDTARP